ncbi:hypothetical protein [Williamsia deligens]|uniref:Cell division protein FtsL n=1 Tax=Williamsia deligens TaxID=321325 RepID=A0ABW3G9F6_9NOCA|nr:hypothetical protein [Williamsia deligens]MCP2195863.1 hypothetical protein [Williamsia deligens]
MTVHDEVDTGEFDTRGFDTRGFDTVEIDGDGRPPGTAVLDTGSRDADRTGTRRDRTGAGDRARPQRSAAAQRAIDRRRRRTVQRSTAELVGRGPVSRSWSSRLLSSPATALRRMPFAVMVAAILAVGLALTLWLSTTAAEDSYGLSDARAANATLSAQRDALNKSYEFALSAPELAKKAGQRGLIPAKDVARMVVGADGRVRVVGDPTPAAGSPAPTMNDGSQRTIAPQPGSSTDGNTAQAPASATTPGAGDPALAPAPNVLPGTGTTPQTATPQTATPQTATPQTATAPQSPAAATPTAASGARGGANGSTDSSVPR